MDLPNENKTLHIFVDGHVQGVGFRYFVKEKAETLGVKGWVRNRYDGSVEIMAQGNPNQLENLLNTVQIGPSSAVVTNVKFDWEENIQQYLHFSALPTE